MCYPEDEERDAYSLEVLLNNLETSQHETKMAGFSIQEFVNKIEHDCNWNSLRSSLGYGMKKCPIVSGTMIPRHPIHNRSILISTFARL